MPAAIIRPVVDSEQLTVERAASALGSFEALAELRRAVGHAKALSQVADQLVREAVQRCRSWDCPWDDIGEVLGISRQAAHQRYTGTSELKIGINADGNNGMSRMLRGLVEGPTLRLADVQRTTGGPAGVFTIWYRDALLYLGHARHSAEEAKLSNRRQADGARGRLVGVRRQPPKSLQRVFAEHFTSEFGSTSGGSNEKRSAVLLNQHGVYRLVETVNGRDAVRVYETATSWLPTNGYRILAFT